MAWIDVMNLMSFGWLGVVAMVEIKFKFLPR